MGLSSRSTLLTLITLACAGVAAASDGKARGQDGAAETALAGVTGATGCLLPMPAEPLATAPPALGIVTMPVTVVRPPSAPAGALGPTENKAVPVSPAASKAAAPRASREASTPRSLALGSHGEIQLGGTARRASRWKGYPISLSLRDAPLPEVLRSFARIAGLNLVLDPHVQGTVTVELHDVPWDQALAVILKSQGLRAELDGHVWLIGP